jgi:hypothetical protein
MTSKFAGLALDVDKPARLVILHPITRQPLSDKDGKAAHIDVYSNDSEPARVHARAVSRRRLAMRDRGKITPEELEADGVGLLAVLTAGWHLVSLNGEVIDVAFSVENARELYSEPSMAWLREQVDAFATDRSNFSKASSTN